MELYFSLIDNCLTRMRALYVPAVFSKSALLLVLICCLTSAGVIASPVPVGVNKSKPFRSDEIALRAVKLFEGNDGKGKDGPMSRMGYGLAHIFEEHRDYTSRGGKAMLKHNFKSRLHLARIKDELITIDAIAVNETINLRKELLGLGLQDIAVSGRIISGRLPINTLRRLARSNNLQLARPSYAITQTGSVTSQGDVAQASDIARVFHGLDGSGITVDGIVNAADLAILKSMFFGPPGPSGLVP